MCKVDVTCLIETYRDDDITIEDQKVEIRSLGSYKVRLTVGKEQVIVSGPDLIKAATKATTCD